MAIESETEYINGLVDISPQKTAEAFSEQIPNLIERGLFNRVHNVERILQLNDILPGDSVLDIGSGKNTVVNSLKERGVNAVGIDLASERIIGDLVCQNPNVIANSLHLPFADKSFDSTINYYGGLTYPLYAIDEVADNPEKIRNLVLASLMQLREAVRVSSRDVRTYPWSLEGIYDASGLFVLEDPKRNELAFSIDFKKLFEDMGIDVNFGVSTGTYLEAPPNRTLILDVRNAELQPLDNLIETVLSTNRPLIFRISDIKHSFPEYEESFRKLQNYTGYIYHLNSDIKMLVEGIENNIKDPHIPVPSLMILNFFDNLGNERVSLGFSRADLSPEAAMSVLIERKKKAVVIYNEALQRYREVQNEALQGFILNRNQ